MPIHIESLIGKRVTLRDLREWRLVYEPNPGTIRTGRGRATTFIVENSPVTESSNSNIRYVSFRVEGTSRYLTLNPYGDQARAHTIETLSASDMPMLLPEMYETIIDYIVGVGTSDENFEGVGFNYEPMKAEESQYATVLHSFCIEGDGLYRIGLKSFFGKYWRSQHWDCTISQAPHMQLDETWSLTVLPQNET